MSSIMLSAIIQGFILLLTVVIIIFLFHRKKEEENKTKLLLAKNARLKKQVAKLADQEEETDDIKDWYKSLFKNTNAMVFVYEIPKNNTPSPFIEVNKIACEKLNFSHKKLLSMTLLDVLSQGDPLMASGYSRSDMVLLSDEYMDTQEKKVTSRIYKRLVDKILQEGSLLHKETLEDRSGKKIPVEIESRYFNIMGRRIVMSTARDITKRQSVEKELHESRQRFQDFLANSPIGIAIYNAEKELKDVNLSCLKIFGSPSKDEFAKFNIFNNSFIPPNTQKKLDRGESVTWEAKIDFSKVLEKSMFITGKTGHAYLDIMITNMGPDPDNDYQPRGYFAQIQDISDRRKTEEELQNSEQQLRQAEKMEALGSMAGGIAHDFNNILTPILGYAKMVFRHGKEDKSLAKYAEGIIKAGNRAKDLVGQILTFSRKADDTDQKLHPITVIPIAKEVLKLQHQSLTENIKIDRIIKTEHDIVMANPTKIHQILMNLCTNARHSMKEMESGTLELRLTDFVISKRGSKEFPELEPGRYLRISIKDTGSGIPEENIKRIFEPFFTTKRKGEGTGMGLSVVHGIVTSYNGTIKIDTQLGKGTTFHVILPTVEGTVMAEEAIEEELPTGDENILIVDDDLDVAETISDMLKSLGYDTTCIGQGFSALKLFTIDPDHFELVITDQVMPQMTGMDLAKEILAIRPKTPIILCTGYNDSVSTEDAKAAGIYEYMLKPVSIEDLSQNIRKAINEKRK